MNAIGIDIGATFIKSAVLDLDAGAVLHRHCVPFPAFIPDNCGRKEVWLADVAELVDDEIERHRRGDEEVVMCGQMGGFIDDGKYSSWMADGRIVDDRNFSVIANAVSKRLGLSLLCTPVGDHQCALLGAGLQPGELSLNIATGSQVSMIGWEPQPEPSWQRREYFGGETLRCKSHIPAGRALNGLLRLVRQMSGMSEDLAWGYVIEQVSGRRHTDLRWNLSFWPSEVGKEGHLLGILEDNLNVGDLFLAAFKAMASGYREIAMSLGHHAPQPIVFSGGLVRKLDRLRESICEALPGTPWRMATDPDETLAGLLRLAQMHIGDRTR